MLSDNKAVKATAVLSSVLNDSRQFRHLPPKVLGYLRLTLSSAQIDTGNINNALIGLYAAKAFFERAGSSRGQAFTLANIGLIYLLARDYQTAENYFNNAKQLAGSNKAFVAALSINRGIAFRSRGDWGRARHEFLEGLTLAKVVGDSYSQSAALGNLVDADLRLNDLPSAREHLAARNDVNSAAKTKSWWFVTYSLRSKLAFKIGDTRTAVRLLNEAVDVESVDPSTLIQREFEETAYQIYKSAGRQADALDHLERFKQLDDQARMVAASTNAALMAARFNFTNQNARIAQLRQQRAEQDARIQRDQVAVQRQLLMGLGLIAIVLLLALIAIRRSRNEVRAANDELTGTNAELEHALAARTEFLATTSHEIRTPLNGILGMTQVLLADRTIDAGVRERITLVQGAGETMKALVDDILDVAKIANGELRVHPAEMDLPRLLKEAATVWAAQASTKDVAIELDIADAPERIVEDEVRLRQIVFNLMANAVKFTDRGRVRLTASLADGPDGPGALLRVAVADTGVGIPADRLDDIFESFRQVDGGTTRRHGGTGLGLAICRNLARIMGGDVSVESVLGGGSTFSLVLPCTVVAAPDVRAAPTSLAATRLLLLDANPLSRSVLTALLAPHAARVVQAGDVEEVRPLIADGEVDLIVADGGAFALDPAAAFALTKAAGATGARTVLLWPTPEPAFRAAADAAGILRIVAKPIAAQELVAALRDIYMTADDRQEIAA